MAASSICSALSDVGTIPRLRVGKRRTGSIVPVIWQFLRDAVVGFFPAPRVDSGGMPSYYRTYVRLWWKGSSFRASGAGSPAPPHRSRTWGTGPDRSASDERSSR